MKFKLVLVLVVALTLGLSVLILPGLSPPTYAATLQTKAECAGNPLTISVTAPSSATPGSTITATNISSTSTVPNGITVNKIVSTTTIINGSPNPITGTWTGAAVNTLSAQFPNFNITVTGAVGSQVKASLTSIDLYINGGATPITCSVGNGDLTANAPGESLTIFTMPISSTKAAPTVTPITPSSKIDTQAAPLTPSISAPPAASPATSPVNNTQSLMGASTKVSNSSRVNIVVKDHKDQPIKNAKAVIDSLSVGYTDNSGKLTFASIPDGRHKIAISANNKVINREFQLSANKVSSRTLTIALPKQPLPITYKISGALAVMAILGSIGLPLYRLNRRTPH